VNLLHRKIKIGWIGALGIFFFVVVFGVVIGHIIGPQSNVDAPNQPVAASSSEVQSISVSDATATIATDQPQTNLAAPIVTKQQAPTQPSQSASQCAIRNYLPDPNCTPGAIDSAVTQENIGSTICASGYTATVRPSTSVTSKIKTERMQAYGDTDSPNNYELDHFIPLELGGSPASVLNLFPEPYAEPYGARSKDKAENYLHGQVCSGTMTLVVAQEEIKTNWVSVYTDCCSTATTQPAATAATTTQSSGHTFYMSTYRTSKYYYCDTDPGWKSLSTTYLKSYPSEAALLADYPSQVLHASCQ
jgi:hypothetical protein